MRRNYRSWLPEAALKGCGIEELLAEAVHQWSAKWLARERARPLGTIAPLSALSLAGEGATCMALDDDLAIVLSASAHSMLVALTLNRPLGTEVTTDADEQILADLVATCIDDLCRRISVLFRLPSDGRWSKHDADSVPVIVEPRGCGIGIAMSAPLLWFVASTELMVSFVKTGLAMPLRHDTLQPITAGLAAQPLMVSASLGRCTLTLADLAELNQGDVLVFDREAGSPVPLALDGVSRTVGCCSIEQEHDRFHLKLLESISR